MQFWAGYPQISTWPAPTPKPRPTAGNGASLFWVEPCLLLYPMADNRLSPSSCDSQCALSTLSRFSFGTQWPLTPYSVPPQRRGRLSTTRPLQWLGLLSCTIQWHVSYLRSRLPWRSMARPSALAARLFTLWEPLFPSTHLSSFTSHNLLPHPLGILVTPPWIYPLSNPVNLLCSNPSSHWSRCASIPARGSERRRRPPVTTGRRDFLRGAGQ